MPSFLYIPNLQYTGKVGKMAFGMASNLFHLRHNFLTRKCPSLSTKRHFLKHTEIYASSEMIAYAPQDILPSLPVLVRLGICNKKRFRSGSCLSFPQKWVWCKNCHKALLLSFWVDRREMIVEACPPPDSGRGWGPTETSGR